jgi:hypothetical protein
MPYILERNGKVDIECLADVPVRRRHLAGFWLKRDQQHVTLHTINVRLHHKNQEMLPIHTSCRQISSKRAKKSHTLISITPKSNKINDGHYGCVTAAHAAHLVVTESQFCRFAKKCHKREGQNNE